MIVTPFRGMSAAGADALLGREHGGLLALGQPRQHGTVVAVPLQGAQQRYRRGVADLLVGVGVGLAHRATPCAGAGTG
ncbi:hypothetical protein GCM10009679_10920 [Saccharothrix algeriensis]